MAIEITARKKGGVGLRGKCNLCVSFCGVEGKASEIYSDLVRVGCLFFFFLEKKRNIGVCFVWSGVESCLSVK